MYYRDRPHKARSHCHGWSAAPVFFLSQHVLGIQPLEPGYAKALIAPQIGNLTWAHGRVPTPRGVIECRWERSRKQFHLEASLPAGVPCRIELPLKGRIAIERGRVRRTASGRVEGSGPNVALSVSL